VNLFSAQTREKGIVIRCELSVDDADVVAVDKFKIDQVLRNLISNALKFSSHGSYVSVSAMFQADPDLLTTRGGGTRRRSNNRDPRTNDIDVEEGHRGHASELIDGRLSIKVTDTGAGISPENQQKLFKGTVQFNPEKLQAGGGSGFGLYICKGIVDLHGGTISVFSEGEGHGSTFTLELPMTRGKASLSSTELTSETPETTAGMEMRFFEVGHQRSRASSVLVLTARCQLFPPYPMVISSSRCNSAIVI
jgi:two-component system, NarL family, sensor histidine kinase BarA